MKLVKDKHSFGISIMLIGFMLLLLIIGGHCEFEEDVMYRMPEEVKEEIQEKLGENASTSAIVEEYINNKDMYQ